MGANVSSAVSNITNEIKNELSQISGSSADCSADIKTGDITVSGSSDYCPITISNNCQAVAQASIEAVTKAAAKAAQKATPKQKTALIPGFNAAFSQQDIETAIETEIKQKCQANADVTNKIATGNITLAGNCRNSPITINNSGNAVGNCAVNSVIRAINDNYQLFAPQQSAGDITALLKALMAAIAGPEVAAGGASSLSISLSIFCICCVFLLIFAMTMMK